RSSQLSLSLYYGFSYLCAYAHPRGLHPFPTRRSSDLARDRSHHLQVGGTCNRRTARRKSSPVPGGHCGVLGPRPGNMARPRRPRSEEHTSELQSRENLVCRLLLEKKKSRLDTDLLMPS